MLTICSGWGPAGWGQYGRTFVETFNRYAAGDIKLVAYVEDMRITAHRATLVHLDDTGFGRWVFKHKDSPFATGTFPIERWKEKEVAAGYSYRFDAVKFGRQGFIPIHTANTFVGEFLAWFDGDVVFKAPFAAADITGLLPAGKHIAYLGREPKHSEIGFQLYRLPDALPHLEKFRDLYWSEEVFKLHEWHSAYVFDVARKATDTDCHNLTPGGRGHVWRKSPLARFSEHLKGDRKGRAR